MISIPLFSPDTYYEPVMSYDKGISQIVREYKKLYDAKIFAEDFKNYIDYHTDSSLRYSLLYVAFTDNNLDGELNAFQLNKFPNPNSSDKTIQGKDIPNKDNYRID